jgi:hypothetical protein
MGAVERRLEKLEGRSREDAVTELRRAWASFTDEEVATVLAPYAEWAHVVESTGEVEELRERTRAAMPEELIARAIGLTESMETEEIDRRIRFLVRSLGIFERGEGIRRHMLAPSEGRRKPWD